MSASSVSRFIAAAVADRDREAKRAAAELVWRCALVEGGYGAGTFDPIAVHEALSALGRDARWLAQTARQLKLVREGEDAEAAGGAVEQANAAMVAATAALDEQAAKIREIEATLAAAKRETFEVQSRQIVAIKQQEAARQVAATGAERREALYRDETLAPLGGWRWLFDARTEAREAAKAVQPAGGES